jgi:hypothetical protein
MKALLENAVTRMLAISDRMTQEPRGNPDEQTARYVVTTYTWVATFDALRRFHRGANEHSAHCQRRGSVSVTAVPPLARSVDKDDLSAEENRRLIAHIEADGVRTLLCGGNANFYHVAVSEHQ